MVAGPKEFIEKVHRWRKMLGGGWRQAGVVAAPGEPDECHRLLTFGRRTCACMCVCVCVCVCMSFFWLFVQKTLCDVIVRARARGGGGGG